MSGSFAVNITGGVQHVTVRNMHWRVNLDGYQFVERADWIPSLGVQYLIGVDGISVLLVGLTAFLAPIVILSTYSSVTERAREYMPALANLSAIRCWTGFRAATPDSLPLIGPDPARARVWLATGHEGLGISTCFGTGRLIAAGGAGWKDPA